MKHALVRRARVEGTPLIDGESATFVWAGRTAPRLLGDFNHWDEERPLAMSEAAPGVWALSLSFPRDAYVEYGYLRGAHRAVDPLNQRRTPNGLGGWNHWFYMPEGVPTPLIRRARGVPAGVISRHAVATKGYAAGRTRTVYLYRPPGGARCPLLVVHDGSDYLRRARLPQIVDNLIAQRRIPPVALALVANGGAARTLEYACSEATLLFLIESVVPFASEELGLVDLKAVPGAYGIMGASMGGLSALYAGLRAPAVFGHVLSQSGAFTLPDTGAEFVVHDMVLNGPAQPLRIWMDVGTYEELLPPNQRMHAQLASRGYDVAYREYHGGHNYVAWRNDVWRGLEHLMGAAPPSTA